MRHFVPVSAESPDSGSASPRMRRNADVNACARIPEIERDPRHRLPVAQARDRREHAHLLAPYGKTHARLRTELPRERAAARPRPRPPGRDRPRSTATQAGAGTPSPAVRRPAAAHAATGAASSRFPRPAAPSACPRARRRRTGPASRSHRRSVAAAAPIRHTPHCSGRPASCAAAPDTNVLSIVTGPVIVISCRTPARRSTRAAAAPASVRAASIR